jgi:integrase
MDARGHTHITIAGVLEWAQQAPGVTGCARRVSVVRLFARYVQATDPETEVPPAGLVPVPRRRLIPYLFSEPELSALMRAASQLDPPRWGQTVETVLGLLWATGMRVGEPLRLTISDVSLSDGVITIWRSKHNKSRQVPLAASATDALQAYDRTRPEPPKPSGPFFTAPTGEPATTTALGQSYKTLLATTGVPWHHAAQPPRVADLRHSFAVRTLLGWYRTGADVQALLPRLSTYLGHQDIAATYWYLSAAPELLSIAVGRLEVTS